jgi:acyl-CoA reductase-like NAD-dependent aldehyde dehydrogenase
MLTNWCDGTAAASASDAHIEVLNPAHGTVLDVIPAGCAQDVDAAVAAARRAFPGWAATSPMHRRDVLLRAVAHMSASRETVIRALIRENGKPRHEAAGEVDAALKIATSFAELAVHLRSGAQGAALDELVFQHRTPRGVAACIVPWNYPVAVAIENLVPNLVVGNTVVLKPSEKTPLTTRWLMEVAFAELPPGVCNVVLGDGRAGEPLASHPDVDVVVFVGSERTGRRIAETCGRQLKKVVLELGGKDAFIVDDTADVARAARLALTTKFTNAGQICTATERIYVQSSVFDPFVEEFTALVRGLRIGDGQADGTDVGPLIDGTQRDIVHAQVQDAVRAHAEVLVGGRPVDGPGFFYEPTVLIKAPASSALIAQETFGPVAPVQPFGDFEEALALANDSSFGLAAVVCTESAPRAIRAIHQLNAGMVKINTNRGKAPGGSSEPFRASGMGHGYGIEFLAELTIQKSVHWRGSLPR